MAQIPGTVVAAAITTGDTTSAYSIGNTNEMQGGHHQVADLTARDAISADRRSEGMVCWVIAAAQAFRLVGGIDNSNWQPDSTDTAALNAEIAARIFGDGTVAQQGTVYALALFNNGTGYTNTAVQSEALARVFGDGTTAQQSAAQVQIEAGARVFGDGTVAQQGSNFAYGLFVAGTNYTNSAGFSSNGSQFALNLYYQGTSYTDSKFSVAVFSGSSYTDSQIAAERSARVFSDGTVAQHGSEYSYDLWLAGTDYTNSRVAASGSEYAYDLWLSGTNYTNAQVNVEIAARMFGDGTIAQQGSNFSYNLYKAGTNYSNSLISGANGSEFAYDLWLSGTNYTNAQVSTAVQNGSQFSVIIRDQGTSYTNLLSNTEIAARIFGDGTVAQQGSNFAYGLFVAGTNYANSLVSGASGSEYAYDLWLSGTNYTNSKVATAVQNGSQFSVILRDQGTNYANLRLPLSGGSLSGDLSAPRVTADKWSNSQTTITFGSTINVDFDLPSAASVSFTGNGTFTTSNRAAGRMKKLRVVCDGTTHSLGFPAGWTFLGASAPTSIAASKTAILSLECWGSADTDITAAYAVQP